MYRLSKARHLATFHFNPVSTFSAFFFHTARCTVPCMPRRFDYALPLHSTRPRGIGCSGRPSKATPQSLSRYSICIISKFLSSYSLVSGQPSCGALALSTAVWEKLPESLAGDTTNTVDRRWSMLLSGSRLQRLGPRVDETPHTHKLSNVAYGPEADASHITDVLSRGAYRRPAASSLAR